MKSEFFTRSPLQTKKAGKLLAQEILKSKKGKKAFVLGLVGDLGGGKTTFLQGFAKGLKVKEKVLSPTFIIMRRLNSFYHIDCYRTKSSRDILSLGFEKITANPKNIVAVEWADKVRQIMPKNAIWVKFEFINEKERKIMVR